MKLIEFPEQTHIFTTLEGLMMSVSQKMDIKHMMTDQRLHKLKPEEE